MLKSGFVSVMSTSVTNTYTSTQGRLHVEKSIESRIDLVLVKKDMLKYVRNLKTVRGIGKGILYNSLSHVVGSMDEEEYLGEGTGEEVQVSRIDSVEGIQNEYGS